MQVSAEGAKQDKISIWIGEWIFEGPDTELIQFVSSMSERPWPLFDSSEYDVPTFRRFQSRQGSLQELRFTTRRRGGNERIGAPLISGSIQFKRRPNDGFGPSQYTCSARVTINPTRALVHQPVNRSVIRAYRLQNPNLASFQQPRLTTQQRAPYIRSERPIDPRDDNVILDRHWMIMSRPEYWGGFRDGYIAMIFSALADLFNETFESGQFRASLNVRPRFNVKEVETYWEFRDDDPVRKTNELAEIFRGLGTAYQRREYENVAYSSETLGNVPTHSVQIAQGVRAVLYPKTNSRIRLEVRHDLREFNGLGGGHVFGDIEGVISCINVLAEDATQKANELLDVLSDSLLPSSENQSAYRLVSEIVFACENECDAQLLLSCLVNHGSYRVLANDRLRQSVRRLLNRDVLMRSRPNGRTYLLRGQYRAAARLLASNPSLAGLQP